MTLRILTPEGLALRATDLEAINIPISDAGRIGIQPGHAPLLAETAKGNIVYKSEGEENQISLYPGVLEIRENNVVILTAGEAKPETRQQKSHLLTEYSRMMQTLIGGVELENKNK